MSAKAMLNQAEDEQASRPAICAAGLVAALSRYLGQQTSRASLAAGLPLQQGCAAFEQLPALARRAELSYRHEHRTLAQISSLDLPAILKMSEGRPVLVIRLHGDTMTLLDSSGGVSEQLMTDLEPLYSGEMACLQPSAERASRDQYVAPSNHWLWRLVWSARGAYGQAAFGAMVVNVLALAVPFFVMTVYDRIIPNQALESLAVLAVGVLLIAIIDFSLRGLRAYILDHSGRRLDTYMGNQVFNHVLHAKKLPQSAGGTANSIRELDVLREFLNSSTVTLLADLPFLLLFIGAVYWLGGPLAWVPAIIIPVTLLFFLLTQIPLHRQMKRAYENASHRNSVLFEVLNGMESIQGVGGHNWAAGRWEKAHAAGVKTSFAGRFYTQLNQHALMFAQTVTTVLTLVFGVILIGEQALTFGALFACVILVGRAMAPLSQVAGVVGRLHAVLIAWQSISVLMKAPIETGAANKAISLSQIKGDIVFDQVDFGHPIPGTLQAQAVLRQLSFSIKAGEKVAVVGTIGAGKTSLLRLLLGNAEPSSGTVRLDGVDVREIHSADLRSNMGYVPQNLHFFKGSLQENICIHAEGAAQAQIERAAALAGIDGWLSSCPLGLQQPVAERGDSLSGGQKQSLALARALLNDPPILLMDEPTSKLDSQSEAQFVRRLRTVVEDKTLLLITHRPALLALVDRVVVLDKGQVVMDGPKDQVLAKLSGQPAVRPANAAAGATSPIREAANG